MAIFGIKASSILLALLVSALLFLAPQGCYGSVCSQVRASAPVFPEGALAFASVTVVFLAILELAARSSAVFNRGSMTKILVFGVFFTALNLAGAVFFTPGSFGWGIPYSYSVCGLAAAQSGIVSCSFYYAGFLIDYACNILISMAWLFVLETAAKPYTKMLLR